MVSKAKCIYTNYVKFLTVEPACLFYFLTFNLLEFINMNLFLQKACRFTATEEPSLDTNCDDLEEGIKFVAFTNATLQSVKMVCITLFVIFSTSWSDTAGRKRKIFIILPIVGQLLQASSGCLQSYVWTLPATLAAVVDVTFQILSGGFLTFLIFSEIYVADVSTRENRTARLGILMGVRLISGPISKGMSGYLVHDLGFFYSYLVCLASSAIALLLAYSLVPDISYPVETKVSVFEIVNPSRIMESFKVVFQNVKRKQRILVTLLMLNTTFLLFIHEGEYTVFYLYLKYRFNWDERMYGLFLMYGSVGVISGTVFTSIVLSKLFKIHDAIIGMFAGFWNSLIVLGYGFATENWQLNTLSGMDMFFVAALGIGSSYLSKFYKSQELGHLFSVNFMFKLLVPICHPAYNILFQKTMNTMPNAFFIVSFPLHFFTAVFSGVIYYLSRNLQDE